MERSVSVSSDRNIRDHLWRRSTSFDWNNPTETGRSISLPTSFPGSFPWLGGGKDPGNKVGSLP